MAHHERYYCPEIVSDHGESYHYLDVLRLCQRMRRLAAPRQREVFEGWLRNERERDVASAMGVPGQPVFIYVEHLFVKTYRISHWIA
jgi:hypothetical protein